MENKELNTSADKVADLIISSKNIVIFTGAGISTESGIPDFRGPGGIWSRYNPDEFTIQKFMSSQDSRKLHWQMFVEGKLAADVEPNLAHYAIAELEKLNKLDCVVTQNVDNLHQKAGVSPDKVFELHGNMQMVRCMSCDTLLPIAEVLPRAEREGVPDCERCHGILKPDAVFFGEMLPEKTLSDAMYHARHSDLFFVIGSTLIVYPAAQIPVYAVNAGARLVIINRGATPLDSVATVLIDAGAGEVMSKITALVKDKL